MSSFEIPPSPSPQVFSIDLAGENYAFSIEWRDEINEGWYLTIEQDEQPLLSSIPMVPGVNLLEQHEHVGIGGALIIHTKGYPEAPPTRDNLGKECKMFFVTP